MRGFTLVELVIVVLIVGIVAALGYPALVESLVDARLYAVSGAVVTAFEFAQLSAMTTGRSCRVTVDNVSESILVEQLTNNNIAAILNPAVTQMSEESIESTTAYVAMDNPTKPGSNYVVDFSGPDWFGGVDIFTATFGPGDTVVFNTQGTPSEGGQVVVTYGGRQVVVVVDALTGGVTESM